MSPASGPLAPDEAGRTVLTAGRRGVRLMTEYHCNTEGCSVGDCDNCRTVAELRARVEEQTALLTAFVAWDEREDEENRWDVFDTLCNDARAAIAHE